MLQSSAYNIVLSGNLICLLISLIAIRKSETLIENPWGNPFFVSKAVDKVFLNLTSKVLKVIYIS